MKGCSRTPHLPYVAVQRQEAEKTGKGGAGGEPRAILFIVYCERVMWHEPPKLGNKTRQLNT